jgi:hypothetical protein
MVRVDRAACAGAGDAQRLALTLVAGFDPSGREKTKRAGDRLLSKRKLWSVLRLRHRARQEATELRGRPELRHRVELLER